MMSFSGNPLDRVSELRADPAWIAARRAEALILPLWRQKIFVTGAQTAMKAARLEPDRCEALAGADAVCVFLGLEKGRPLFALDISGAEEDPAGTGPLAGLGEFYDMRAAAFVLPGADTAILGQAKALIDWHQRHRFCSNCGAATDFADGGWRRICPRCTAEHFPRTDPVVIMLPIFKDQEGGDLCLIGRNKRFPTGLYSAFAGFLEPGETVEEAVRRELREEVYLAVDTVSYHASQPWPFPSALMIGCYAAARWRDFKIDGHEIEDARWMRREEIRARLDDKIEDAIKLPAPIAIAHHLIRDWAERV
jgi:NAD+ diphosphatase